MKTVKPNGRLQRLFVGCESENDQRIDRGVLCRDKSGAHFWLLQSQKKFSRGKIRERLEPISSSTAERAIAAHERVVEAFK